MVNLPKALKIAENKIAESGCICPLELCQLAATAICPQVRNVVKRTYAPIGAKFVQARQVSFKDERALYTARSTQRVHAVVMALDVQDVFCSSRLARAMPRL